MDKGIRKEKLKPILAKERLEFDRVWHGYHAKYKIPYSYDDSERFFNSMVLIFREE